MAESIAQSERQALCDLLETKGPLAPTLCEGWTTSDLVAHLYVRESKPLKAGGIAIKALANVTERAMDKAKADVGYEGLIAKVRSGPPFPFGLVDSQMNSIEYFVHHEDVRRGGGDTTPRVDASLDQALWTRVRQGAKFMSRHYKSGGLELIAPGFGSAVAKTGDGKIVVRGGPQELMLLLFGRMGAAQVELDGPPEAQAALRATSFGV